MLPWGSPSINRTRLSGRCSFKPVAIATAVDDFATPPLMFVTKRDFIMPSKAAQDYLKPKEARGQENFSYAVRYYGEGILSRQALQLFFALLNLNKFRLCINAIGIKNNFRRQPHKGRKPQCYARPNITTTIFNST